MANCCSKEMGGLREKCTKRKKTSLFTQKNISWLKASSLVFCQCNALGTKEGIRGGSLSWASLPWRIAMVFVQVNTFLWNAPVCVHLRIIYPSTISLRKKKLEGVLKSCFHLFFRLSRCTYWISILFSPSSPYITTDWILAAASAIPTVAVRPSNVNKENASFRRLKIDSANPLNFFCDWAASSQPKETLIIWLAEREKKSCSCSSWIFDWKSCCRSFPRKCMCVWARFLVLVFATMLRNSQASCFCSKCSNSFTSGPCSKDIYFH